MATGFGLKPVRRLNGTPYMGDLAQYEITNTASVIYYQAPVTYDTDGSIRASAAGEEHLGIFLGCEYDDAAGKHVFAQFWPGSDTTKTNCVAQVADSPDLVFEAVTATALGVVPANPTLRGLNVDILVPSPAGTVATGMSLVTVDDYRDDLTETAYKIYRLSPKATVGSANQIVEIVAVKHSLWAVTSRTGVPAT